MNAPVRKMTGPRWVGASPQSKRRDGTHCSPKGFQARRMKTGEPGEQTHGRWVTGASSAPAARGQSAALYEHRLACRSSRTARSLSSSAFSLGENQDEPGFKKEPAGGASRLADSLSRSSAGLLTPNTAGAAWGPHTHPWPARPVVGRRGPGSHLCPLPHAS